MVGRILIENDLFNISNRIKNIDGGYEIYFNQITRKFELHNNRFFPTLQLVFPFKSLDARALLHCYKTFAFRNVDILNEIENHNQKLTEKLQSNLLSEFNYKACELVSYLEKGGQEVPSFENL